MKRGEGPKTLPSRLFCGCLLLFEEQPAGPAEVTAFARRALNVEGFEDVGAGGVRLPPRRVLLLQPEPPRPARCVLSKDGEHRTDVGADSLVEVLRHTADFHFTV